MSPRSIYKRKDVDSLGRKAWTASEDKQLKDAIKRIGLGHWTEISKSIDSRTPDACRKRWEKVLDPTIKKGSWLPQEDTLLSDLVRRHGSKKWTQIASQIAGRTDKQCRQRWFDNLAGNAPEDAVINGRKLLKFTQVNVEESPPWVAEDSDEISNKYLSDSSIDLPEIQNTTNYREAKLQSATATDPETPKTQATDERRASLQNSNRKRPFTESLQDPSSPNFQQKFSKRSCVIRHTHNHTPSSPVDSEVSPSSMHSFVAPPHMELNVRRPLNPQLRARPKLPQLYYSDRHWHSMGYEYDISNAVCKFPPVTLPPLKIIHVTKELGVILVYLLIKLESRVAPEMPRKRKCREI
ncbi:hypothetical protein HK096_005096 [Nowakowskiella sp. JEL0078]|nr:hypothetical protein HK096_005096 [Nowakowskiella sp. JEL0078]